MTTSCRRWCSTASFGVRWCMTCSRTGAGRRCRRGSSCSPSSSPSMSQIPTAAQMQQLPTAAQIRQLLTATVPLPAAPPTRAAPLAVKIESWDDEAGTTREKEGSGDAVKGDAATQAREMRLLRRRGRYAATRAREMWRRHGRGRCGGGEAESDTGEGD